MKPRIELFGVQLAALFAGFLFCFGTADVLALSCGDTVLSDTLLESSLDCEADAPGLFIGADNVTIDLNGFTIKGGAEHVGIFSSGYSHLKVLKSIVRELI